MSAQPALRLLVMVALLGTLFGRGRAPVVVAAAEPTYRITDLGALSGGTSYATGINAAGQVVGYSYVAGDPAPHAVLWARDGAITELGVLAGQYGIANGINASDQVVGFSSTAVSPDPRFHAFLWESGVMRDLGALDGAGGQSYAYAINAAGQVVGRSSAGRGFHAVLWQGGTMTDLGTLGGAESQAYAINDAGWVVGASDTAEPYVSHAVLWRDGQLTDLGTLGDDRSSTARGINSAGQVVGYSYTTMRSTTVKQAFLWQDGRMTGLGTLGGRDSEALGINDAGQVVGSSTTAGRAQHAFLWQDGQLTDLNTLIPANSGWELRAATAINAAGQIVGNGTIGGQYHAFLLTPTYAPLCFSETGQCIEGRFLAYWQRHGGLALNGYPLTGEFEQQLEDGKVYRVQYFERVRMEYHPENQPPYDVLLGQFGRRIRPADPPVPPIPGQAYFPETGHNLGDGFLAYWQANGGLMQFGYPISEVFEQQQEDGKTYRVQYFERARFEHHPENAPPYDILLGQFGRQILAEVEASR